MGAERREMSKMETENSINVVTMRNPRRLLSLSDCRLFLLIFASLFFLLFLFFSNNNNNAPTHMNPFTPLITTTTPRRSNTSSSSSSMINMNELRRSRIAVCLVGGARRFQLTGPSIVDNILNVYPNSDLFLHSPFDSDSFKFSLLKTSPRIASVRIFKPQPILQTESQLRVLSAQNSPQGIQGLLQYFNLVEGCLTMIKSHQHQHNFTYHWIVRTRVDGFWSRPLSPDSFIPGHYVVPPGSSYGGLNDRLGVGDLNTSLVALSRLSLIPQLDSTGFQQLNSETAFKAQLMTQGVPYLTQRTPFCVVSDRRYDYPPSRYGVPVAAMSSRGPLSGAKCRPCRPVCSGSCVGEVMSGLDREWSWTEWDGGSLELCDAHGEWENGWESRFDGVAGKKLGDARKRVRGLKLDECVADFEEMRRRTANWEAPQAVEICAFGLKTR